MTRKRRRLYVVLTGMALLSAAVGLMLVAFQDSVVFFYSPSDIKAEAPPAGRAIRLGGLVQEGTVHRLADGVTIAFRVTDKAESVPVTYRGILPDLFREGQGVVTEGRLDADGTFVAQEVLAKHDETYMPREVADALKKSGQWRGANGQAPGKSEVTR